MPTANITGCLPYTTVIMPPLAEIDAFARRCDTSEDNNRSAEHFDPRISPRLGDAGQPRPPVWSSSVFRQHSQQASSARVFRAPRQVFSPRETAPKNGSHSPALSTAHYRFGCVQFDKGVLFPVFAVGSAIDSGRAEPDGRSQHP
ncbi:unnamed protein product [Heligmosomoides polygyrus]|uniref:Uncharacterized protein n=1 Tax=Heligmosomoides polygyrus TaxID=6339 RepID=A0A183GGG7_HELPZ|nr:unnamed protein product [Heligmosomoides polygyrus]